MRMLVLSAVLAVGCRGKAAPDFGAIYKFLPATPDLAVRLDVAKVRAWPNYVQVAPTALGGAQSMLDAAKTVCNLDVITEVKSLVIAKRGSLHDGDLTIIGTGLAPAKVRTCLQTLQRSDSQQMLTVDGDVFHVATGGKSLGSGALLPSGELVFVMRNGGGVEPAAWKTELAGSGGPPPAWWAEMNATDSVAVRIVNETAKRFVFSTDLGDPLLVHGSIISATAEAAKNDLKTYKAMLEYLNQAGAGTGRLELSGETIFTDLTAKGPQVAQLIKMALPALFPPVAKAAPPPAAVVTGPVECASLAAAVASYLKEGLSLASASQKTEMERLMPTLLPRLQKAFVDRCTEDKWSAAAIQCHLTNATQLAQFEKCNAALEPEQRTKLDQAITQAMPASPGTP